LKDCGVHKQANIWNQSLPQSIGPRKLSVFKPQQ
jgi:hypothetical protein